MSVTSGFFNSIDNDRRYNASQMSAIFNGIIRDGVFMSLGKALLVSASQGMTVLVGSGRAWFDGTWTDNDSDLPLVLDQAEIVYDRIDAIILETNRSENVRANSIKIVKGEPGANPKRPIMITDWMTQSGLLNQRPLAYIYVKAKVTSITQADITNMVGSSDCPFVTGILSTISTDALVSQWQSQFTQLMTNWGHTSDELIVQYRTLFEGLLATWDGNLDTLYDQSSTTFNNFMASINAALAGDVASNLLSMINAHKNDYLYRKATGTGTAISVVVEETLVDGLPVNFIALANNGSAATTLNGKPFYKPGGTTAPTIIAGRGYTAIFNSTSNCFFFKASTEGSAVAANVLAGKTFSNDSDTGIAGAMTEYGSASRVLSTSCIDAIEVNPDYPTIYGFMSIKPGLTGHIDASTIFKENVGGLLAENIKAGVKVGNNGDASKAIVGTFTADSTATDAHVLNGRIYYRNGVRGVGGMPSNGSMASTLEINGAGLPTKNIPAGYTTGGLITSRLAEALASVIKDGEQVGGVFGTYSQVPTGNFVNGGYTLKINAINPDTRMVYCSLQDNKRYRFNFEGTLLGSYVDSRGGGYFSSGFTDAVNVGSTRFFYSTSSNTQYIDRSNEAGTVLNSFQKYDINGSQEMKDVFGFGYSGGFLTTAFSAASYKIGFRNWSGTLIAYLTSAADNAMWYSNSGDYSQKLNAQGYPYIGGPSRLWVWGETTFRTMATTNEINEFYVKV